MCSPIQFVFHTFLYFQETISAYPMQGESIIIAKGSLYPLPCGRGLSSLFEPNEVKKKQIPDVIRYFLYPGQRVLLYYLILQVDPQFLLHPVQLYFLPSIFLYLLSVFSSFESR